MAFYRSEGIYVHPKTDILNLDASKFEIGGLLDSFQSSEFSKQEPEWFPWSIAVPFDAMTPQLFKHSLSKIYGPFWNGFHGKVEIIDFNILTLLSSLFCMPYQFKQQEIKIYN